jgi:hypothetical protein
MPLRWPVVICIVQVIFAIFNYGKLYSQIHDYPGLFSQISH